MCMQLILKKCVTKGCIARRKHCDLLVNLREGMQSSSEQPLVGEERYVTTLTAAAKETTWKTARENTA